MGDWDEWLETVQAVVGAWRDQVDAVLAAQAVERTLEWQVIEAILPVLDQGATIVEYADSRMGVWILPAEGAKGQLSQRIHHDALSLLAREGYVMRTEKRPNANVYTITDAGIEKARGGMPF